MKESLNINIKNKIVVLDEAHHCEEVAEDQKSSCIDLSEV